MQGLACPACQKAHNKTAPGPRACAACGTNFPNLAAVPVLWPSPGAALLDWRNRFNFVLTELEARADRFAAATSELASSRSRIALQHSALQNYQRQLQHILKPLAPGQPLASETHLALRTRLPHHHRVDSYMQNVFRDWCWGGPENTAVLEHLQEVLAAADVTPARVLVLGAGAGRLAYDLHRALAPSQTVALEANPLLCLIGNSVSQGTTLELNEFATAPLTIEHTAITRTLTAPATVTGLSFVCADALNPPIRRGHFDLIVTPWLLDVIDAELPTQLRNLAHLLSPGGTWLTHGSVAFTNVDPAMQYTATELAELASKMGFEPLAQTDSVLPYLQSPASRNHRVETVLTLVCRRNSEPSPAPDVHQHTPEWLIDTNRPVPLNPAFQTQVTTTRVNAFIMSLLDGKRSIKAMAKVLEEQRLMPEAQAREALRQFLTTMHNEAQAQQRQS